jgi:glycosyltransferase involved in cell wall biosynthesis
MHLHLIEPLGSGHRLQFVRRLVETAAPGLTWSLSTFPSTRQHPAFAALAPRFTAIHELADEAGHLARSARARGLGLSRLWWRLLHAHWLGLPADTRAAPQLVPYLDYILHASGLSGSPFGTAPLAGIAMRPSFHYRAMGVRAPRALGAPVQRWLLLRLLARPELLRFFTLDEPLAEWLRTRQPRLAAKVTYVQDPADLAGSGGNAEGRAHYGVRAGQRVVLSFGSISGVKGVDALLMALAAPACPAGIAALVVGAWQPALRPLLERPEVRALRDAGRLHVRDAYVDAQEEHLAFAAADAVWLGYRDFYGSSGVLMQAAKAGVPVVGCRDGLVGWSIARHRLGVTVDIDDAAAVLAALQRVLAGGRAAWPAPAHLRDPPALGPAVVGRLLADLGAATA